MMRMKFSAAILGLLSVSLLSYTFSSVPSTISYQGRITDNLGMLVADGTYSFSFAIYDAQTAGNLLWSEMQDVAIVNGSYQVALGQSSPIPFSVFTGKNAWLEVRFEDQLQSPRRQIVSAPFALKAEGEVPEGGIILGAQAGNTAILNLGYVQESDTVGNYYLYKKQAYNPASPRVPQRIAYQGRVTMADGSSVGNSANLIFSLYDAASGGSLKWTENQNNVPITNGIFSVELGAANPIYPTTLSQANLWLQVAVNGEVLSPREKLSSVGYALKVESPIPTGGIVLSGATINSQLSSKKFTSLGATLKGYYLFQKSAFSASDPAVPLLVNYQGRLSNAAGVAIVDSRDFHFSIYDHLTGPALLWSETISGVSIPAGIYNVLLGGVHPLTPAAFPGPDAFLQIQVIQGTTVETLSPRARITSVPFALSAEGTLPPTSFILGDTVNMPALLNSGFTMTGDTIGSFHLYSKTDADITPPLITFVSPQDGMTTTTTISIHITYTDTQSGVDTSTLHVYHNDTEITTSLSVGDTGASGSVTGSSGEGGNLIRATIADRAGNISEESTLVLIESGLPPVVNIVTPSEGETVRTNTPFIRIEYSDPGSSGVDTSQVVIFIDGVNWTLKFEVTPTDAELWVNSGEALGNGGHYIEVWAQDYFGHLTYEIRHFQVDFSGSNPAISTISPNFTVGGDTVTITGMNFGDTVGVYFAGTLGPVEADSVWPNSSTQVQAKVPGSVISGDVWVQNRTYIGAFIVGVNSDTVGFTYGLPYAYITNRGNSSVTVYNYHNNTFAPGSRVIPGGSHIPYQADVTPDGRWVLVADYNTTSVTVLDILDHNTVELTLSLACGATAETPPYHPQAIAISPDGSQAFVGNDNQVISVIEIRKLLAANPTCRSVSIRKSFAVGSQFRDLEFSPDGKEVLVATDNTSDVNGKVLMIGSERWYQSDANSNTDGYLRPKTYEMTQTNSKRNPSAVGFLPQRVNSTPGNPWWGFVVNMGANITTPKDFDQDSVVLLIPEMGLQGFVFFNAYAGQQPPCFGGVDVAVTTLGDKAWFACNYSNNIGLLENPTTNSNISKTTAATSGCASPLYAGCVAPWIKEVAYTPYDNKVIAAIWGGNAADSDLKVLDPTKVLAGHTIPSSAYTSVDPSNYVNGPEGIGVWPHFDRDGDKISDLIEATNADVLFIDLQTGEMTSFNPTLIDSDPSRAYGTYVNGWLWNSIRLPHEGIGYRHFIGPVDELGKDNWGILRTIKVIEAVGREWNQSHKEGPRISIGDISPQYGRGGLGHASHQNGKDIDVRYILNNGTEGPMDFCHPRTCVEDTVSDYNQSLSQELVNLFIKYGASRIWVDELSGITGN